MGSKGERDPGSGTELPFYLRALLKGAREGNACSDEVEKAALTGSVVRCVLLCRSRHSMDFWRVTIRAVGMIPLPRPKELRSIVPLFSLEQKLLQRCRRRDPR